MVSYQLTGGTLPAFSQLMLGAQAPGTQVEAHPLTILDDSSRVYIRQPLTVGVSHGMAYIMTKLRRLATQLTLQFLFSFDYPHKLL